MHWSDKWLPVLWALILMMYGCRTTDQQGTTGLLDSSTGTISAPYAQGSILDIDWALRFNMPDCNHPGQKTGAWCEATDASASATKSGIEDQLKSWINNPAIKEIRLAYFSFSNKQIVDALCKAANDRGLKVTLYIHGQSVIGNVVNLETCSPQNIKVVERGTTFGTTNGYLQHAKIFLASEIDGIKPLSDLQGQEATDAAATTLHIASSSANMSSFGTSLHFENWMFLDAKASTQLAQANLCFFKAI